MTASAPQQKPSTYNSGNPNQGSNAATQRAARNRYLDDTVTTVSSQQLVVMLYDRLLRDCDDAHLALVENRIYDANKALQHAQDILIELHAALDTSKWDGGPQLASLYIFLLNELTQANVKKDAKIVVKTRAMISPIRDAWAEAAAMIATGVQDDVG